MYTIVWTCLDIAHAVRIVLRYIATPEQVYMTVVERIFHYLWGMSNYKLTYQQNGTRELMVYSNSDWTDCYNLRPKVLS